MSGFYGKVLYQFTRLFDKIKVTPYKDATTALSVPEVNASAAVAAGKEWDTIYLNPSNHWIQLGITAAADPEDGPVDIITFGHSAPSSEVTDNLACASSRPEGIEDTDITQIKSGDYIAINQKFDNAGHLNAETTNYYRFPIPIINIGQDTSDPPVNIDIMPDAENDKLFFNGDNQWITLTQGETNHYLDFKHSILTTIPKFTNVDAENNPLSSWMISYNNEETWEEALKKDMTTYPTQIVIKITDADGNETEQTRQTLPPMSALNCPQENLLYERYSYYPTAISMPAYNSNSTISVENLKMEIDQSSHRYDQSIIDYVNTLTAGTQIYTLHQGDILETQHIIRDQMGHILDVKPIYLQLPYSETDQANADMKNTVDRIDRWLTHGTFENSEGQWIERYGNYETNLDLLAEMNTFLTTGFSPDAVWYPENLSMLTGLLTDMYTTTTTNPNTTEVELTHKDKTLASTIGQMDGNNGLISKVNEFCTKTANFYSLSSAIQEILSTQTQKNNILDSHTVDLSQIRAKSMPAIVKILNLMNTGHLSETDKTEYEKQIIILNTLYETATS